MVKDNSPIYNEMVLLETIVATGVLGPKRRWDAIVKKIDKHVTDIEAENAKLKDPHIKLDHFVPGLQPDDEPRKWGEDKVEGQGPRQGKLGGEGEPKGKERKDKVDERRGSSASDGKG